jgi:hypothetical protein
MDCRTQIDPVENVEKGTRDGTRQIGRDRMEEHKENLDQYVEGHQIWVIKVDDAGLNQGLRRCRHIQSSLNPDDPLQGD